MKTTNRGVAAMFAEESGNAHGSNFYTEDNTIYSYGSHFPIAGIRKGADGRKYVIFTREGYSMTTAKHISYTNGALACRPELVRVDVWGHVFDRPSFNDFKIVMRDFQELISEDIQRHNRARTRKFPEWVDRLIQQAEDYAAFAGFKVPVYIVGQKAAWNAREEV